MDTNKTITVEADSFTFNGLAQGDLNIINMENFDVSGRTINNIYREFAHLSDTELLHNLPAGIRINTKMHVDMARKLTERLAVNVIFIPKHADVSYDESIKTGKPDNLNILKRLVAYTLRGGVGKAYRDYRMAIQQAARETAMEQSKVTKLSNLVHTAQHIKKAPVHKTVRRNTYVENERKGGDA